MFIAGDKYHHWSIQGESFIFVTGNDYIMVWRLFTDAKFQLVLFFVIIK